MRISALSFVLIPAVALAVPARYPSSAPPCTAESLKSTLLPSSLPGPAPASTKAALSLAVSDDAPTQSPLFLLLPASTLTANQASMPSVSAVPNEAPLPLASSVPNGASLQLASTVSNGASLPSISSSPNQGTSLPSASSASIDDSETFSPLFFIMPTQAPVPALPSLTPITIPRPPGALLTIPVPIPKPNVPAPVVPAPVVPAPSPVNWLLGAPWPFTCAGTLTGPFSVACPANNGKCKDDYYIMCTTDLSGERIGGPRPLNADACVAACSADSTCVGAVSINTNQCQLYNGAMVGTHSEVEGRTVFLKKGKARIMEWGTRFKSLPTPLPQRLPPKEEAPKCAKTFPGKFLDACPVNNGDCKGKYIVQCNRVARSNKERMMGRRIDADECVDDCSKNRACNGVGFDNVTKVCWFFFGKITLHEAWPNRHAFVHPDEIEIVRGLHR